MKTKKYKKTNNLTKKCRPTQKDLKIYCRQHANTFNQFEEEVVELNTPGNVIMFKSFINHKVSPVISGERRTLALFLSGPNFK